MPSIVAMPRTRAHYPKSVRADLVMELVYKRLPEINSIKFSKKSIGIRAVPFHSSKCLLQPNDVRERPRPQSEVAGLCMRFLVFYVPIDGVRNRSGISMAARLTSQDASVPSFFPPMIEVRSTTG